MSVMWHKSSSSMNMSIVLRSFFHLAYSIVIVAEHKYVLFLREEELFVIFVAANSNVVINRLFD